MSNDPNQQKNSGPQRPGGNNNDAQGRRILILIVAALLATLLINNNDAEQAVSVVKASGVVANLKLPARSVTSVLMGPSALVPVKKGGYYARQ